MLLHSFLVAVLVFQACVASSLSQQAAITNYGYITPEGTYPYQVSIRFGTSSSVYQLECFGSILDKTTILTTAYCASSSDLLKVIAGKDSFQKDESSYQESPVSEVRIHEGYEKDPNQYNIAVLKIKTPLIFNKNVSPVQVPPQNAVESGDAVFSRWRIISKNISVTSVALQEVTVPILDNVSCQEKLSKMNTDVQWKIYPTQMCTDTIGDGTSYLTVFGSPLVQRQNISDLLPGNKTDILIGMFSWGYYLYPAHVLPGVYTRISKFTYWINDNRF